MKIFTCTDFTGHFPVGTTAVVVANDLAEARSLLARKLSENGLTLGMDDLVKELDITIPRAIILNDGDY